MLTEEEQIIIAFMKTSPDAWFAAAEIGRKASIRHFREDPRWAYPALVRLSMSNQIESDPAGHYRYIDQDAKAKERQEQLRKQNDQ